MINFGVLCVQNSKTVDRHTFALTIGPERQLMGCRVAIISLHVAKECPSISSPHPARKMSLNNITTSQFALMRGPVVVCRDLFTTL